WPLPAGYAGFRFVLRVYVGDDVVCTAETGLEFETPPPPEEGGPGAQPVPPCAIRADGAGINVRVGPGLGYAVFGVLTPGVEYPVVGYALDSGGNRWWELDRTWFPGHEAVHSLWVASWV